MIRIPFQTDMRAAAVELLRDYAEAAGTRLQVYRARPASIQLPTAFVDRIRETLTEDAITNRQRRILVDVVVLHGLFDSGDAVDQRDLFVDGFLDYVADRFHEAGANTLIAAAAVTDVPVYVPDWMVGKPLDSLPTYFASVITLEGYART